MDTHLPQATANLQLGPNGKVVLNGGSRSPLHLPAYAECTIRHSTPAALEVLIWTNRVVDVVALRLRYEPANNAADWPGQE